MKRICFLLLCAALLLAAAGCSFIGREATPPETAAASPDGASGILVTWSESPDAQGYRIFRKTEQMQDFRFVQDQTGTSYQDSGVEPGVGYQYMIQTLGDGCASEGVMTGVCSLGAVPQVLDAALNADGSATVRWSSTGAQSYCLYGVRGEEQVLLGKTEKTQIGIMDAAGYSAFCVSGEYAYESGERQESGVSGLWRVLETPVIDAVSRLDKYTAVIQLREPAEEYSYRIYRADTAGGEYQYVGESRESVYYDETWYDQPGSLYKVKAFAQDGSSAASEPVAVGTNQKQVVGVPVLMYHEFVTQKDLDSGVLFDEYAIRANDFELDLIWLKNNGYTTITTQELADYLNGVGTLPEKPIMLTIDDGKYGVYKNAWPLLQKYDMKAVLSVIGSEIDKATKDPTMRGTPEAPFCTWEEIGEMSASGHIEMISHTHGLHAYSHKGRIGGDVAVGETAESIMQSAYTDYLEMQEALTAATGKGTIAQSYPYSKRSEESDRAWMECGYQLLLSGDQRDDRPSYYNYFIEDGGINGHSAVLRRMVRMNGHSLILTMENAIRHDR